MKEINILCVEDGSVDVESLENEGLHDGKVIIYRQGANPPFVLKLKTDDEEEKCDYFTAPYNYGESTDTDYNICNICNYHEQCNDKVKSNFDIWNYCPNCGAKIKRGEER